MAWTSAVAQAHLPLQAAAKGPAARAGLLQHAPGPQQPQPKVLGELGNEVPTTPHELDSGDNRETGLPAQP